ncbi:unnamed protein product, partial [Porites lobata]
KHCCHNFISLDTSEVEVETLTVSQKRLPTSIRQFPDKEVKEGIPSDDDLELLSVKVVRWKKLGRRLKLEAAELTALHQENEELSEKVFAMLIKWKQKKGRLLTVVYMTPSVIN